MTVVVLAALGLGVGLVGIIIGCRAQRPSLHGALTDLTLEQGAARRPTARTSLPDNGRLDHRMAIRIAESVQRQNLVTREFHQRLALANTSLVDVCARCLVCISLGCALPIVMWLIVSVGGLHVPGLAVLVGALILGVGGGVVPIAELNAEAKRNLRQAKRVICSFLDLVVLGLAGGMGIESALLTAAQLGENPVSRRMFTALSISRDSGEPPWHALTRTLGNCSESTNSATSPPQPGWQARKGPRFDPPWPHGSRPFVATSSPMRKQRRMP